MRKMGQEEDMPPIKIVCQLKRVRLDPHEQLIGKQKVVVQAVC